MDLRVLGTDVEICENTIPVISPDWRLKRSGNWILLWQYDPDEMVYQILSPNACSVIPLFDGVLTLRQIAWIVQYGYGIESVEECVRFLFSMIENINKEHPCIVQMNDTVAPFIKTYDPLDYMVSVQAYREQARLASPLSLNVMFSNSCETDCMYCYADRRHIPVSEELSLARWLEIFYEAKDLGIEQISLSGGDPLFRRDALVLIAELIKLEMLFLLSTKCHVTPAMADQLSSMGMKEPIHHKTREVQISLDGPDRSVADVLAGSRGYFDRAMDSIQNLVARDINLRVKAVITPLNAPRIYEWAQLLHDAGVKRISCAAYNRSYFRHDDRFFLSDVDRVAVQDQFDRIRSDFPDLELLPTGFEDSEVNKPQGDANPSGAGPAPEISPQAASGPDKAAAWRDRAFCSGGRSSITITPDGKVVLCDTVPQTEPFIVGDLATQSIREVWHSEALIQATYPPQERFAGTPCYECEELLECHILYGYCFRDSYFNYGTLFAPPPKCPKAYDDGMRME
jgi:radical SAM protein with 4Fe4S-binding SPASM domain